MASLSRTSAGLLLRENFDAANGWTAETGFSRIADPCLVTWGKLRVAVAPGGSGSSTRDGVREPVPIVADGKTYVMVDAGDGTTGWLPFIVTSTDRLLTVSSPSVHAAGYDDGASGTWASVAGGWLAKWGSTWYSHRITVDAVYGPPLTGLPAGGYGWDVWTGSTFNGPWTYVRTIPLGGTWTDNLLPCSIVHDSGTYYNIGEGSGSSGFFQVTIGTSSTPSSAITTSNTGILSDANYFGSIPENGRCYYHTMLARWVIHVNLITGDFTSTGRNAISLSTSLTDWSAATSFISQSYLAACDDTAADIVGVATHFSGPDGQTFEEDGYVPGLYDHSPTDGNHLGRKCSGLVWEPATHCLNFSDVSGTRFRYYKASSNTDFVAEFQVVFPQGPVSGSDASFEFRVTSGDGYRLMVRNGGGDTLRLEKMDGTGLVNGTGTVIDAGVSNRIKVVVSGTSIKAYINKELQIDTTDASYSSGTQIAFSAKSCDAKIRLLSMYESDTITVTGLTPSSTTWLRTHGGFAALPVVSLTANGSGVATVAVDHYPLSRLEFMPGEDAQTTDRLIWGGDELQLDTGPLPPPNPSLSATGLPVFGG